MVAVIKVGHSMHRIFNYNENKVKEAVAECIGAENYPLNAEEMNLKMKLNFLLKRVELNENVKRNSVHISLNFDPSETHLGKEKLNEIANTYMQKLGFSEQPYLVYQHHDAGHPHLHIVTTNIEADGKRIDLHHLGIRKSEPARKEIEKVFGLIAAEAQKKQELFRLKPVSVSKALYGKSQTKMAIQNILENVLDKYKYTSLPELNAVLKLYNVMAERGGEQSRIFKSGGLVYRILDEQGKPVGVPIKASLFYNKSTLKFLETKFSGNETQRVPHKARVKNAIDMALLNKKGMPIDDLIKALKKQGIDTVLRQNEQGIVYGITYIDHQTKCVFNGSVLGKQYRAKAIQERCLGKEVSGQDLHSPHPATKPVSRLQPQHTAAETKSATDDLQPAKSDSILEVLMQPEQAADWLPKNLKRKRKRKQTKNISDNR